MTHRTQILKLADLPSGPEEQASRLAALSESFYKVRETKETAGQPVGRLNTEYDAIHDLWRNLDLARGETHAVEAEDSYGVKTDPLTQLKVAASYGVLDSKVANDLQHQFRDAVNAITGKNMTPAEIKRLHKLMTQFNPFQP